MYHITLDDDQVIYVRVDLRISFPEREGLLVPLLIERYSKHYTDLMLFLSGELDIFLCSIYQTLYRSKSLNNYNKTQFFL